MARQNRQAAVAFLSGHAKHQFAHRLGRAAKPVHGLDRERIGILFGFARIGRRHQRARREDQGTGAGDVAEQQSDQERRAAIIDQVARAIAVFQMTKLVSQDAGDLIGVAGLGQ